MTDRTAINGNSFSPIGPVPIGWGLVRVVDIATKVGSGATPKGGDKVYLRKRISHALVRSQHVFDRRFESGGLAYITDDDAHGLRNAELRPGDILLNITGDGITFGRACLVPDSILPACVNQHVSIIRVDKARCLPGFLVSYLTHPTVKEYIESFNAGGSRRAITKGHIESFEVPLPPLDTQQRISDNLGALDDKIELNRRMNETLEAMARRLFKSWFVDFDPVHAKAALRREHPKLSNADLSRRALPNMAPEIAELFPDSFEDSTLGPIPKGWRVARIADACEKTGNGGTPRRDTPSFWEPATIPWLTSGEVRQSIIVETENGISQSGLQNSSAKMWPAWSTIVALYGATAGQSALSAIELCANQACCGLQPRDGHRTFLYLQVSSSVDRLERQARGSAQQNLSKQIVEELPVILPLCELMHRFDELATPALSRWVSNLRESRKLEAVRDKLLPRLLSGEVGVQVAEGAAEVV